MLKDCIDIFEKKYNQAGDALITDNYTLDPGTYILVDKQGQIVDQKNVEKNMDNAIGLDEFIQRDYLSKLISMNKPIDNKKVIHSNNYLSFWIKKESIKPDTQGQTKLSFEIIENYYNILKNPRLKYKGKSLELYEDFETFKKEPNSNNLDFCESWIKENIFELMENQCIKADKSYLKIFFQYETDVYLKESQRYILPNIYNTTDYNIVMNSQIFGLPNNNMGMNAKKPYLENKGRIKSKIPYLISTENVYLQKKFFDYLFNYANQGKTNIYFSTDDNDPEQIYTYKNSHCHVKKLNGYFLRIQKGMELEIQDYDLITGYSPDIEPFTLRQVIPIPKNSNSDLVYSDYIKREEIQKMINDVFFKKVLIKNYFIDANEIKLNDFRVKEELLRCRSGFFSWFYKGDSRVIKNIFPKSSLEIVKNSIGNNFFYKAIEQFNVRDAFITYFEGGKSMADQLIPIREGLRIKINTEGEHSIENDLEYYYAVGQLSNYYVSKNKTSKLNHSLVNPILNCKTDLKLKDLLKRFFIKYNYDIKPGRRFGNIQSMIFSYIPDGSINDTVLIAGYLSPNLLYESNKEKQEDKSNVK
ncbi:type I-B CRISPR-associated protein Cas8b/Csh1 [Acetobacterium tundrae]|uniref:Type I-B CRISPR-associated protein Cas8b/Csh1 n=1 Tax=Acetobacterium tundrae TaxID=132932 RepID=A0ABR6WP27_9FIRM|nr:type I-B CRISPR-associated protein Cas8b/Csh1 [Acetobacterium tundrae]MBC3798257.1 type I-B CRISPR-associated protein Cas8b/Csh1 [Acetobacterium tundrae]